ncbi:hypothetical protein ACYZT2_13735 [Pseudomonas sp. MDT1-85]
MDIQSSTFNQLFVLYPVIIQGWVTPVKPDGIAHGGIPKVLYDGQAQGLECLIDPWTELKLLSWTMAADDRIDLYKQGHPTPITGKTVAPGEEQLRIRLYLPHGWLDQGVNGLYYKVTRVGGNVEQSRDLLVLYHLRLPDTLDVVLPPDVIQDGVGPERAAQGVPFGFTYNNRRNFDRIEFSVGDATFRFDVPDAPTPITHTLFTDSFEKAGDNPSAVVEFKVFDQLGNVARSPEKRLDIHLGRVSLQAPTVRGMNGNQFSPVNSEVRVLVPQGPLLPNDKLWVKWKGATDVAAGSYTSPQRLVSAGLVIAVPRSVLAYSLGQQITATYVFARNGIATESPPLLLNILTLPATALIPPMIVEADANNYLDVLALGAKNATIHALLHTLIEAGQPCWLRLEGKKSNDSVHELAIWSGLPSQVNATWINQGFWPEGLVNSYLKQLGHGTMLTIKYKVALDKSNVEANAVVFPDRVYTIKAVELAVPTLDNVLDSAGKEVLEAGLTVSTTLKLRGTASKGLRVEIFDGNGASAVSKGTVTANETTGIWEHIITIRLGARRLYAKSLYHNTAVYSNVRNLTVTEASAPTLTSVRSSPRDVEIPNNGFTAATAIMVSGVAAKGQKVIVLDGTLSKGQAIADATSGAWMLIVTGLTTTKHSFTAKALYGSQPSSQVRVFSILPVSFTEDFSQYPVQIISTLETTYMTITSTQVNSSYVRTINQTGGTLLYFVCRPHAASSATLNLRVPCSRVDFIYSIYSQGTPNGVFFATFYGDGATPLRKLRIPATGHADYTSVTVEASNIKRIELDVRGAEISSGSLLDIRVDDMKFNAQT